MHDAITKNLDLWTSASLTNSSAGRGSNGKQEGYGIKKLRELILELAVRGKLVPQDPDEESGCFLLERIAEEKARSSKDGRTSTEEKLPAITDSDKPFSIPSGWDWIRLGSAVELVRGITFPASEKSRIVEEGRVACLRTANVQERIEWDDMLYVRRQFVTRDEQFVRVSDIVMSTANSRELVGKVAIVEEEPESQTAFGGFLTVLRPILLDPSFVMVLLRAPVSRNALIDSASQTTNIANISSSKLNQLVLAVPPLAEQKRIVAKVDELMTLCDQLEQQQIHNHEAHHTLVEALLGTLSVVAAPQELSEAWTRIASCFDSLFTTERSIDQLKQTILQLAVMGKLVRQDSNDEDVEALLRRNDQRRGEVAEIDRRADVGPQPILSAEDRWEIPAAWAWRGLADLVLFVDYRGKTPAKQSSGIRLLTARNVRKGQIDLLPEEFLSEEDCTKWMTRGLPKAGDVLFTTEAPMGNAAVVHLDERFALAQRVICFQGYGALEPTFLVLQILSNQFQAILDKNGTGMTAKGIKASKLKQLPVAIPPLAEQRRIVAKVSELVALCDALMERLAQAQTTQIRLADAVVEQAVA